MTRKDYELIALAIRETRNSIESRFELLSSDEKYTAQMALNELSYQMAKLLQEDNPNFNYLRFIERSETLTYSAVVR